MADRRKKEVIPRQSQSVEPRHAETPAARWNIRAEGPDRIVLDAEQMFDEHGQFSNVRVASANAAFKGKRVEYASDDPKKLYRPISEFQEFDHLAGRMMLTKEGKNRLEEHRLNGERIVMYDDNPVVRHKDMWSPKTESEAPKVKSASNDEIAKRVREAANRPKVEPVPDSGKAPKAPIVGRPAYEKPSRPEKPTRESKMGPHPQYPHVKLQTFKDNGETKLFDDTGKQFRNLNEARNFNARKEGERLERILQRSDKVGEREAALRELEKLAKDQPRGKTRTRLLETAKAHRTSYFEERERPVLERPSLRGNIKRPLKKYREGMRLGPTEYHQRAGNVVRRTSFVRASRHRAIAAGREFKKEMAVYERERKAEQKAARHAAAVQRDKDRRAAYDKSPARAASRAAYRQRKAAERVAAAAGRIKNLTGFGKIPLKKLMRDAGLGGRMPGKKGALAAMPRSKMYPTMDHATRRGMPAGIKRELAPVMKGMSLGPLYEGNTRSRIAGTKLLATQTTVMTDRFPDGGRGIFFRINAAKVLANLEDRYPRAVQRAIAAYSDKAGRQLLDIVEPYVPKDTGLLYSTAMSTSAMSAGGLVDIEGAVAYPSDQMFGVSISYNAPYAEIVYFDTSKRHGAEYNRKYGPGLRGEKETARWIEVAYADPANAGRLQGILAGYGMSINAALNAAGGK